MGPCEQPVCVPAHGLLQLLPGHEAVVLPDLAQRALELLLVLVLGALRLLLLLRVPSSLPVVQPAGAHNMEQSFRNNNNIINFIYIALFKTQLQSAAMPFMFMN